MTGSAPHERRLRAVDEAFRSLPDRYLGAEGAFDATYHIRLGDIGRSWEIRATTHGARVRRGVTRRRPDVTIGSDAATWLRLREGRLSGLEAYAARRLSVRGNLDLAIAFEGLWRLPNGRPPLQRVYDVDVDGLRISNFTMGSGPPVLLLHGLGSTRASFFETAATLSERYTVHAPDLPGSGSSAKPAHGPYNAPWFARTMLGLLDALGIERTHVVGNSMGGRVAIEMGLIAPERVRSLGLLCPAVAFIRRGFHPIVRVLRPELGLVPHRFARPIVEREFWSLFSDRDLVDPDISDLMVDEFQRIYASAGARYAFLSSARNIYLDRPFGAGGFYPRLAGLEPPALFVWTKSDRLVPAGFSRHVQRWLPDAEQVVIPSCGHVPQVERAEQTNGMLSRFFARVDAVAGRDAPLRLARAA